MISFPHTNATSELASQAQQGANVSVVQQQVETQQSIKVSASSTSTVTISGETQRSHTFVASGVAKYQAISDEPPKSQAADNILSFISQRLKADELEGVGDEDIAARLQAGYEGFVQGFNEALNELSAAGLLTPEVESALNETFEAVLAGIDELATNYGATSPVDDGSAVLNQEGQGTADVQIVDTDTDDVQVINFGQQNTSTLISPENTFAQFAENLIQPDNNLSDILQASSINYQNLINRDFNFTLQTKDGDRITISASASRDERGAVQAAGYQSDYANYQAGRVAVQTYESSAFNLQIEGELDEDEIAAINDLLNQVGALSETFFSGNIEEAFEQALEIGFDESEIANFSLNLRQEVTTKVETVYTQVAQNSGLDRDNNDLRESLRIARDNDSLSRLRDFIELLKDVSANSDRAGINFSEIPELASNLAKTQSIDEAQANKLESFIDKFVPYFS